MHTIGWYRKYTFRCNYHTMSSKEKQQKDIQLKYIYIYTIVYVQTILKIIKFEAFCFCLQEHKFNEDDMLLFIYTW